jgi:hypothetical protein
MVRWLIDLPNKQLPCTLIHGIGLTYVCKRKLLKIAGILVNCDLRLEETSFTSNSKDLEFKITRFGFKY